MIHVISLGAGVQSTTMALMAAHGEIKPMPDVAIFADTQWEPKAVYDHLDWLGSPNVLPFPIKRVTAGNLRQAIMDRRVMSELGQARWEIRTEMVLGPNRPLPNFAIFVLFLFAKMRNNFLPVASKVQPRRERDAKIPALVPNPA